MEAKEVFSWVVVLVVAIFVLSIIGGGVSGMAAKKKFAPIPSEKFKPIDISPRYIAPILAIQCTDSDGGENVSVQGTVRDASGRNNTDFCDGFYNVEEFFCVAGTIQLRNMSCGRGSACKDGACIQKLCVDSDGGVNPHFRGTVRDSNRRYDTDFCAGPMDLFEYFCFDGISHRRNIKCDRGLVCKDGACLTNQCTDSDGEDVHTKGTVRNLNGLYTDICDRNNRKNVQEWHCLDDGSASIRVIACPPGEACNGGVCVSEIALEVARRAVPQMG